MFSCKFVPGRHLEFFYSGMSMLSVLPNSAEPHFWQHVMLNENGKVNVLWRYVWCAAVWIFWNCRNQSIFQEKRWHRYEVIHQILFQSWSWSKEFISDVEIVFCAILCIHKGYVTSRVTITWIGVQFHALKRKLKLIKSSKTNFKIQTKFSNSHKWVQLQKILKTPKTHNFEMKSQ